MQLASYDSNASTKGITWLKKSCFTSIWSLWPNEGNGAIDNTTDITKLYLDTVWTKSRYINVQLVIVYTYLDIV